MSPIVGLIQSSNASSEGNTKTIHNMMVHGIKGLSSQNSSYTGIRIENGGDHHPLILESVRSATKNNAEDLSLNEESSSAPYN
jgi:hypothetical protein